MSTQIFVAPVLWHGNVIVPAAIRWLRIGKKNMPTQTPPNNLRDLIDSIASARGVTLYKESANA